MTDINPVKALIIAIVVWALLGMFGQDRNSGGYSGGAGGYVR